MLKYYKEFFHYFAKGYRKYVPVVIIGAAIAGVLELTGILLLFPFIQLLIDPDIIDRHEWLAEIFRFFRMETQLQQAALIGVGILLVFVFKNIYLMVFYFWQNKILRLWKVDISASLMRFYLFSPYKLHLLKTSNEIIRNVNNVVVTVLNTFVFQGFMLISNVIAGVIILSLLIQKHFFSTVVTATVLLITSIFQHYFLKRKLKRLGEERNKLQKEQYKNIFQGLHAIKETKVLGREQYFLDSFYGVNRATMNNDMWAMFYRQLPPQATEISAIFCVVIMCIGVIYSTRGSNSVMMGSLAMLGMIAFRTSSIVNRILNALQFMSHSQDSVKILLDEIKSPLWQEYLQANRTANPPSGDLSFSFNRQIRFEGVSYTYPKSEIPALDQINVSIDKGEFVGIVGTSGAGKTTFVDVLLGLLEPEQGQIIVDQTVLDHDTMRCWQQHLGYVPQQVYITNDTVIRNVAFGVADDQIDMARVENALKKANLYEHMQTLPEGLDTPLGENGRRLSGGQKQRVGIARALYYHADVLVLDEATSSLDVPTEGEITRAINALKGQQTIIAIAHRLATLKSCDRILYFDDGKLLDTGTFESLSQEYPKFDEMVKLSQI
ncbi:MAG: ABC transporter ATP-binding protein [Planctomycetota bacterium]|jgi:ATP-binding cassette subfamily C protein